MTTTDVGEYLEAMRQKHARLSRRAMALEAGLSASAVEHIVKGRTNGRPDTLKALADRWGTDDDYREMMRLAGYDVPESEPGLDDAALTRIAAVVGITSEELKAIAEGRPVVIDRRIEVPADSMPRFKELWDAVRQLPDEEFRRVLEFALFERHRSESQR